MTSISTYSGKLFDVFDPQPDEVCLEDIAHALSMNCRYNGHTAEFYSVAEHSVIASMHCPRAYALELLMHDAGEAYLTDVPRPIKESIPAFSSHETGVLMAILGALGLPAIDVDGWAAVDEADLRMLATEKAQLLPGALFHRWPCLDGVDPYFQDHTVSLSGDGDAEPENRALITLPCWDPGRAESEFLARFYELTAGRVDIASGCGGDGVLDED